MNSTIKIGVIGDYDGRPSHIATIATLFQPQLSSTSENPHKLILAYLK